MDCLAFCCCCSGFLNVISQCSWISKLNLMLQLLKKNLEGTSVIFWLLALCLLKGKTFKHTWVNSAIGTAQKCLCTLVGEMTSALLKALHHQTTCSRTRPDTLSLCVLLLIAAVPVSEWSTFSLLSSWMCYSCGSWQDLLSLFHYFMKPHANLKFIVPSHAWNNSAVFSRTIACSK